MATRVRNFLIKLHDLKRGGGGAGASPPPPPPPAAPIADFSASPLTGVPPLTVSFTNLSLNDPTSHLWSFGDGGTSTKRNPKHTYLTDITADVTLIETNAAGSDGETKNDYIVVASAPPPPPDTLLESLRCGGQVSSLIDFSADALTSDILKRVRSTSKTSGANKYAEATKNLLQVSTISRTSNVATVVLSVAPADEYALASGFFLYLTWLNEAHNDDLSFDADRVAITVINSTTFTYPSVGPNVSTYTTINRHEIAGVIAYQVAFKSDGQPSASYYSHICSLQRNDLNGTYNGTFPAGIPSGLAFDGGSLTWGGGSTFTVVVDSTDTTSLGMTVTGPPSNYVVPTLVRNDHSAASYLRPDFEQFLSRWGFMRFMDDGRTNLCAFIKSWGKRPIIASGLGMPLEDMIAMCNQLNRSMWYCVPDWADDDYIAQAAEKIRTTLNPALWCLFEFSNEVWNEGTFPHFWWSINRARYRLKANWHGFSAGGTAENTITSVTKTGGVVTVNMNRAVPFATGTTAVFKITTGSTTGYNTPNTGAVCTVSGNSFSFSGNSGSGTATVDAAAIIGNPSDPLYADDFLTDPRSISARMHGEKTYQMSQIILGVFGELGTRALIGLMGWEEVLFIQETYCFPWLVDQYGPLSDWCSVIGGAPYPILGKAITNVNTGTETLTSATHGLADDDIIYMLGGAYAPPTPLDNTTAYYVRNKTANTFQVSLTAGGAAINLTGGGFEPHWVNLASMPMILGELLDTMETRAQDWLDLADSYGVELWAYEWNISFFGIGLTALIDSTHTNSIGRTIQKMMMDRLLPYYERMAIYYSSMQDTGVSGGSHWGIGRTLAADGGAIGSATDERLKGIDDALLAAPP